MIVTEPQAGRYAAGERTKLLPNRLPDRLERLEAVGSFARVMPMQSALQWSMAAKMVT